MGTTRFSGPVYGAKSLLVHCSKESVAASVTDLEIFQIDVPADEDWFLTRVHAYCDVQGNAGTVDVEDDGTSVLSANITLVSDDSVEGDVAADGGEDEGKKVAASSVLTIDATNGITTAIEDLQVSVYGYIRKKPYA